MSHNVDSTLSLNLELCHFIKIDGTQCGRKKPDDKMCCWQHSKTTEDIHITRCTRDDMRHTLTSTVIPTHRSAVLNPVMRNFLKTLDTATEEATSTEEDWDESESEIGACGCLEDGCMRCGCAEEAVTTSQPRVRVTVWDGARYVEPKLPTPVSVPPVKIVETVDPRALEYLRRVSVDEYASMCKAGMTKKDISASYAELQALLRVTTAACNTREYTVDKKQAPTRLYCRGSAQSTSRIVRNLLVGELTWDFDMVNGSPCNLRFVCLCLQEACPCLIEYCEGTEAKRKALSESLGINAKVAKKLFHKAIYDRNSVTRVKVNGSWQTIKDPFFKAFDKEMKDLQRRLWLRPELEWARGFAREDKGNSEGSFIAFLTQWIEGHCLLAALRVAERFEISVAILMFDGFNAMKRDGVDTRAICDALSKECETSMPGIGMEWTVKEPDYSVYNEDKVEIGKIRVPDVLPPPQETEVGAGEGTGFMAMATEFDKTHFRVDGAYVDEYWNETRDKLTKDQLKDRYIDWQYKWEEKNKTTGQMETGEARFIDRWLYQHSEEHGKRVYRKFDQIPHTLECPPHVYNTWIPWPCLKPIEATEERLVYVLSKVLKHLKVIVGNEWEAFEFNLKFYAQAVQHPHIRGGVMVIYHGAEGTGKTTWMKLVERMFGEAFYSTTAPEEDIWGNFNAQAEDKFMIELSETDRSNMHDYWGRVNGWISDSSQRIRKMRTDTQKTKTYSRFVGTTNNPVAVKSGRRYAVCEASNELKFHEMRKSKAGSARKGKYACGCDCERCKSLVAYHSEMNNDIMVAPETAYILSEFLHAWKLPTDNYALTVQDIPQTDAMETIREGCTKQEERFLRYIASEKPRCTQGTVDGKHQAGTSEYTAAQLYDHFKEWQQSREPHIVHIKGEGDLMQKLGHLKKDIDRSVTDALVRKEHPKTKTTERRRTWILHHEKLLEYFDPAEAESDAEEETTEWPDLDETARVFVRMHLEQRGACNTTRDAEKATEAEGVGTAEY